MLMTAQAVTSRCGLYRARVEELSSTWVRGHAFRLQKLSGSAKTRMLAPEYRPVRRDSRFTGPVSLAPFNVRVRGGNFYVVVDRREVVFPIPSDWQQVASLTAQRPARGKAPVSRRHPDGPSVDRAALAALVAEAEEAAALRAARSLERLAALQLARDRLLHRVRNVTLREVRRALRTGR